MATLVWNGGSGNFTDSNWSENGSSTLGIPGPSDAAVISSGVVIVTNEGTGGVDVGSITASAGATVELYQFYGDPGRAVIIGATLAGAGTFDVVSSTSGLAHGGYGGLDNVTLAGGTTFSVGNDYQLNLQGVITNDGTILVNGGFDASNNPTNLIVTNGVTLTGSGAVVLNNSTRARLAPDTNFSDRTLTIGDGEQIAGGGLVGGGDMSIVNLGTIAATETGSGAAPLDLSVTGNIPVGWVNENLMVANGGTLVVDGGNGAGSMGNPITQTGSGVIEAVSGGTVELTGGIVISGGPLTTDNNAGSVIESPAGPPAFLLGITLTDGSRFVVQNSGYTFLGGVITNNGTMTLDSTGNDTSLREIQATTLAGNGIVLLNNNAGNRIAPDTNYGTRLLTIEAGATIEGGGYIGGSDLSITNLGTIAAIETGSGGVPLTLGVAGNSPASWTNENLIVADGGTLVVTQGNGGQLTQTGSGIIEAVSGGVAELTGGITISGGRLATDSAPGSQIDADANTTLDGITLTGGSRLTVPDNNYALLNGVVTNNGTIALDSTGNPTSLRAEGTLTGNGIVLLNNNANDSLVRATNYAPALTIDAGQTIAGGGYIGGGDLSITNLGTIAAIETGSGGVALTLGVAGNSPASWTNENLIVADGGTLVVTQGNGGSLTQTGSGIIEAVSGGAVALTASITISGGRLATDSAPSSQIDAGNHATLDGIALTAGSRLTIPDNNYALLNGIITNDGTMTLDSTGNPTSLRTQGTLTGNGIVLLNNNANDSLVRATNYAPALTIDAGQTIAGGGYIGGGDLSITNLGTIAAIETDSGGVPLTLGVAGNSPASWTNENLIVANGGTLVVIQGNGGSLTQTGSGIIEAVSGGVVALTGGITISGGQLATDNTAGSEISADASATLDGVTLTDGSRLSVPDNNYAFIGRVITNNGTITLASTGHDTSVRIVGATTLTGSGTVLLNNSKGDRFIAANRADTLTVGAGQTIAGGGQLGGGDMGIVNLGLIAATETGSAGVPLTVYPNGAGVLNQSGGVIEAAGGAALVLTGGGFTNNGTVVAFGGGIVSVSGDVSGSGTIALGGGGTVALGGTVAAGQSVDFTAASGTLALADPGGFAATIGGMTVGGSPSVPHTEIDLTGVADTAITGAALNTASDVLSVTTTSIGTLSFQLSGNYVAGTQVDLISDSGTGTDVFLAAGPAAAPPDDFDGDGMSDVLWRNVDGSVAIWDINGLTVAGSNLPGFADPTVWQIKGNGDFNGDLTSDILWQDTSGDVAMWQMNGDTIASNSIVGFADPSVWSIRATGDFNGDGKSDILWQDTSGDVAMWQMNGDTIASSSIFAFADATVWSIKGAADFNGDGMADILWQDKSGDVAIWEMNGSSIAARGIVGFADPSVWHIAGTGDFNGDGKADILWQDTGGDVAMWEMNGLSIAASSIFGFADPSWHIAGTGDYNGDGKSDILWQNTNGNVAIWEMNGATVAGSGLVGFADATAWHLIPPDNTGSFPGTG